MNEFAKKMVRAVQAELGDAYNVEIKEVRKNNGVLLTGLLITTDAHNVVPTIYLEHFWRAYEEGTTFAETVRRILHIYGNDTPARAIDMSFFKEFEKVQDRICYRLVGVADNRELLQDIPHVEFLDLAICFFYAYKGETFGEGSILIHNSHMELWNTSTAELMRLAALNTPLLFPWQCNTMEEVLEEIADVESEELCQVSEPVMRVLSNRQRLNGAMCLLYQGVLERLAEQHATDFYILPSSVHEVILLADKGDISPGKLKTMIVQVNRTQVAPEEVLSDSLYRYDRGKKCVELIL